MTAPTKRGLRKIRVPHEAWCLFATVIVSAAACSLDRHGAADPSASGQGGAPTDAGPDDASAGSQSEAGAAGTSGSEPPPDAGEDTGAQDDVVDNETADEPCVPASCASLGYQCGKWKEPCAGTLDCGNCPTGGCHDGHCVSVVFVKSNAAGAADGTSWKDAFVTIQPAVDSAAAGTEIWVAEGSYANVSVTNACLKLNSGSQVYGGFVGAEVDFADRHLDLSQLSVLDGQNSLTVVVAAASARLDGFELRNGSGGGGGGVVLANGQGFMLANCRVHHNKAGSWGGGMYLTNSSASVQNCVFEANESANGAGIFNENSALQIDSTLFRGNAVQGGYGGGGALDNHYSSAVIRNCLFEKNSANPYFGGAIYNLGQQAQIVIMQSTFFGNQAGQHGGAIFNNSGAGNTVSNSIFWANTPETLYNWTDAGQSTFQHCDIQDAAPLPPNINLDPLFNDPAGGDFTLKAGSPCIDAADGALTTPLDLLGNPRFDYPGVSNGGIGSPDYADLGAYENQGP